ncbi:MAG: cytochrome c family protein, partial [Pseudomonadota bacterium]|nr:cytochrome c family protein [Pseudomonadota bacterium]
ASLFEGRCATCHVAGGGFHYTPALAASGIVWSGPTLDRFLSGPGNAVPGTAMAVAIHDPRLRADLIAYFASRPARP